MDFTKLNELIALPKKSSLAQAKKNEYQNELWLLFKEESYSTRTEKYLFEGFGLGGIDVLIRFMNQNSDIEKQKTYNSFVSGEMFKKNERSIGFKFYLDILCQLLNSKVQPIGIIEDIIKNISSKSKNKEGNYFGDIGKTVEKYFVCELLTETVLPDLEKLNIPAASIYEFRKMMNEALLTIKVKKTNDILVLNKIKMWIMDNESKVYQLKNENNDMCDKKTLPDENTKTEKNTDTAFDENKNSKALILKRSHILNEIAEYIDDLEKEIKQLKFTNSKLQNEVVVEKKEIEQLLNKLNIQEKEINSFNSENDNLKFEIVKHQMEINSKDSEIEKLNDEVNKQKSVLSVFSADKENSRIEQLNSIASKLKSEYRDYKDAADMEMSVALGENLRFQLESIFKTLAKNGVDIESR